LKNFSQRAIDLVCDQKIQSAIDNGDFDNLPGFGKPFEFDDTQYDPHWWIRRKIEREKLLRIRKIKEHNKKNES